MTSETTQFSPDRALDRLEIQHRVYQFCRAADRLDPESWREVFHPDAFCDHGPHKATLMA